MKNILIISCRADIHAEAVIFCLKKNAIQPRVLWSDDLINKGNISIRIDSEDVKANYQDEYGSIDFAEIDTVWYRRLVEPRLNGSEFHADDLEVAKRDAAEFARRSITALCPKARWINSVVGAYVSTSKVRQLIDASRLGICIPETLIGNCPEHIRGFVGSAPSIYKTMNTLIWKEEGRTLASATTDICLSELDSDRSIQLSPGIYQRKIPKVADIRLTYFGGEYIAIRIDASSHPPGQVDFRLTPVMQRKAELYKISERLLDKCNLLMEQLGLVFGCLDFVETPDGELVFLEVNQSGQFLWVEAIVPEAKVLAKFVSFLSGMPIDENITFDEVCKNIA
jgi:hypothetical protein